MESATPDQTQAEDLDVAAEAPSPEQAPDEESEEAGFESAAGEGDADSQEAGLGEDEAE